MIDIVYQGSVSGFRDFSTGDGSSTFTAIATRAAIAVNPGADGWRLTKFKGDDDFDVVGYTDDINEALAWVAFGEEPPEERAAP